MPDIFAEVLRDFRNAEHAIAEHLPHRGEHPYDPHATQPPAAQPVTLAAAPAQPEGTDMSLATDAEAWYGDLKAKFDEAEQKLPALIADAKKLEGNPIAAVAIQAGEHVAEGLLPPEALTFLQSGLTNDLERLLSLYSPSGSPAPPAEVPAAPAA